MNYIELRSDTCTLPTDEMRKAMAAAEVGDDVYGEDPSINKLENMAAELIGKEAALFLPSGTMANLVAIMVHCQRGDEVLLEADSHIFYYEAGGLSAVAGAFPRTITGKGGILSAQQLKDTLRPDNIHFPPATLLCLENTHNRGGGKVVSKARTKELAGVAHKAGLKVHLDGARIFNAAAALKEEAKELAKPVDSVMFCLSKGLSAPAGSILAGSKDFIEKSRGQRKVLGGGMRQAGVLAAAGIVALESMIGRLEEDHHHARMLAGLLREAGNFAVSEVETNIINVTLPDNINLKAYAEACKKKGLFISTRHPSSFRLVTNRHVGKQEVEKAAAILREAL